MPDTSEKISQFYSCRLIKPKFGVFNYTGVNIYLELLWLVSSNQNCLFCLELEREDKNVAPTKGKFCDLLKIHK